MFKQLMLLLLLVLVVALSGCARATIKTSDTACEASYFSIFKSSDSIGMNACGGEGTAAGNQSEQISEALMGALIKGLTVPGA